MFAEAQVVAAREQEVSGCELYRKDNQSRAWLLADRSHVYGLCGDWNRDHNDAKIFIKKLRYLSCSRKDFLRNSHKITPEK
jgi:hypothetical protein